MDENDRDYQVNKRLRLVVTQKQNALVDVKLTKFYEELSKGGKITVPLEKQIWGDAFAMLTDK